jgi:ABC-2 type transport system permease protein
MSASRALARRAFADGRTRTFSFAALFALLGLIQVVGYENSYPTLAERTQFAQTFGDDKAVRLFYGIPHDLLSTGGYVAWRIGGILVIFAAVWGVFATVRALRAEEDSGRAELVLAAPVSRGTVFGAASVGVLAGAALLWAASWAGLIVGGLAAGPSAYLCLEVALVAVAFAAVGALASQLAPTRRLALGAGMAAVLVALVVRIVADTAGSLGWLRWATPLGWAEEMRPFTGARPWVVLLFAAFAVVLFGLAAAIARRRDVGTGVFSSADSGEPRLGLLSSPGAQALRSEYGTLLGWVFGIGLYAVVIGLLADSFRAETLSRSLRETIHRVGGASLTSPTGALGFYFLIFVFAVSLFACGQVSVARHEEAASRLETLFALPVGRRSWLLQRLALAIVMAGVLALLAAVLAWAAALATGTHVSLPGLLEAALNCLPSAVLFLGVTALAYAYLPRATAFVAYGLVSVAFCWYLFGAILGAPSWTLDLSPFQHVGLVPAQPFKVPEALAMTAAGLVAIAVASRGFERRDILAE